MFTLFDELENDASESTSSPGDFPAKIYPWLENAVALAAHGAGFGGSSIGSSANSLPPGFSQKTSLACSQAGPILRTVKREFETVNGVEYLKQTILRPSSIALGNSGMGGPTGFLTLNTTGCHSGANVSSLSDVLEDAPTVPRKYFLSPTACRGSLRRAGKRGRELPPALQRALQAVAESTDPDDEEKTT